MGRKRARTEAAKGECGSGGEAIGVRADATRASARGGTAAWLLLPLLAAAAVYGPSLRHGFFLDDAAGILENPRLASVEAFLSGLGGATRPLSEALLLGVRLIVGKEPALYHAAAVGMHLLVGVLFALVLRDALRLATRREPPGWLLALGTGLFLLHPLQTESVFYPVQAFSVLPSAALSFGALLCFGRYAEGKGARHLAGYAASLALAGLFRQDAIMLPFVALLWDALLVARAPERRSRLRWEAHALGLALVALPILGVVALTKGQYAQAGAGFGYQEITPGTYLISQFPVVVRYLGLVVAPVGQNLDHFVPVYATLWRPAPLLSLGLLLAVLGGAAAAYRQWPLVALGVGWFFLYLAPTSTIMPLRDLMFEHRLYLPLGGVALAACGLAVAARLDRWPRAASAVCIAVLLGLAGAAWQRQTLWADPVALWTDAAAKSPTKARPWNNIALALERNGDPQAALPYYERAIAVDPGAAVPYFNLAMALDKLGRTDEAIRHLEQIRSRSPDFPSIDFYLGEMYAKKGWHEAALAQYRKALALAPDAHVAHFRMGRVWQVMGRFAEAEQAYRQYLLGDPENTMAMNNLGFCLIDQGRLAEAQEAFASSLERRRSATALFGLATVAQQGGDRERAIQYYRDYIASPDAEARWVAVARERLGALGAR